MYYSIQGLKLEVPYVSKSRILVNYKIWAVFMTKNTSIKKYPVLFVMLLHLHSRHSNDVLDVH